MGAPAPGAGFRRGNPRGHRPADAPWPSGRSWAVTLQSGRLCLGLPAAARGAGPSVAAACGGRVSPGGAATPQDVGRGGAAPGMPGLGSENRSRDELL